jgi:drug/metabolite transporter (DMT)-like permease
MIRRLGHKLYSNAYLLLALTALFWAGNFVVGRGVHSHVPPIALAWARWMLATAIVLPFAVPHLRREWTAVRANLPILVFLGAAGAGVFNTIAYFSLNYTTALNAVVMQSSAPVLIVLAGLILFGERVRPLQALGIAVSLAGVLTMVARGDLSVLAGLSLNKGDIGLLVAMATWAIYTAFLRKRPLIHWLSFTAVTFGVAAALNTPLMIAEHLSGWQLQLDLDTVLAIAYVSVFPSVLSYIFYNRGVELIGANRAGVFMHLVPFYGAALAILLLGEQPQLYHGVGIALILSGVAIAARRA